MKLSLHTILQTDTPISLICVDRSPCNVIEFTQLYSVTPTATVVMRRHDNSSDQPN